ncbi:hypothetical protein T439DRAFT_381753 [Meredithblackwellia eburnea MCA 4105]
MDSSTSTADSSDEPVFKGLKHQQQLQQQSQTVQSLSNDDEWSDDDLAQSPPPPLQTTTNHLRSSPLKHTHSHSHHHSHHRSTTNKRQNTIRASSSSSVPFPPSIHHRNSNDAQPLNFRPAPSPSNSVRRLEKRSLPSSLTVNGGALGGNSVTSSPSGSFGPAEGEALASIVLGNGNVNGATVNGKGKGKEREWDRDRVSSLSRSESTRNGTGANGVAGGVPRRSNHHLLDQDENPEEGREEEEDPLDPLSSLQHQRQRQQRQRIISSSSTNTGSSAHSPSARLGNGNVSGNGRPPSQASTSSSAHHHHQPPKLPGGAEEQSLQQILQSVDLSAALKLVQTVQQGQREAAAAAAAAAAKPPPPPVAEPIPPSPPSSQQHATTPFVTGLSRARAGSILAPITTSPSQAPVPHTYQDPSLTPHPVPTSPTPHVHIEEPPSTNSSSLKRRPVSLALPSSSSTGQISPSALSPPMIKRDRRRTLSLSLGMGRPRTGSNSSSLASRELQRVPDERANLTEEGRRWEAEISKVHLSLSPSTLRRAQNCSKYLLLRYSPIFAALERGERPPNLLEVGRFKLEKEETERRRRRALLAGAAGSGKWGSGEDLGLGTARDTSGPGETDGVHRLSTASAGTSSGGGRSSGVLGGGGTVIAGTSFGPKRNKYPKRFEVYPDELGEFIAVREEEVRRREEEERKRWEMEEAEQEEGEEDKGAPLHPAISRLTAGSGQSSIPATSSSSETGWAGRTGIPVSPLGSPIREKDRDSKDKSGVLFSPTSSTSSANHRPAYRSRENSFDGLSPGSAIGSSPHGRSRLSLSDAALSPSTPNGGLRRAGSLGSGAGGFSTPPKSSLGNHNVASSPDFNSLGLNSGISAGQRLQNAFSSPHQHHTRNASREQVALSEPTSPRLVMSPSSASLSHLNATSTSNPTSALPSPSPNPNHHAHPIYPYHRHSHSQTEGIRSNVSRVVSRIRGRTTTEPESGGSDFAGASPGALGGRVVSSKKRNGIANAFTSGSSVGRNGYDSVYEVTSTGALSGAGAPTPEASDAEGISRAQSQVHLSDQGGAGGIGWKRPRITSRRSNFELGGGGGDGYKSSGGEDGWRRKSVWGIPSFRVPGDRRGRFGINGGETDDAGAGSSTRPGRSPYLGSGSRAPVVLRRTFRDEDSDEEDARPKEILDISPEEFKRLNLLVNHAKKQASKDEEEVLSSLPAKINSYLEEMSIQEFETIDHVGIKPIFNQPRLSASVLAQLANERHHHHNSNTVTHRLVEEPSHSMSELSASDSELESGSESDDEALPAKQQHRTSVAGGTMGPGSDRPRPQTPPRRRRSDRISSQHVRHVTEPTSRQNPQVRLRSQTVSGMTARDATRLPVRPLDTLRHLDQAIGDLQSARTDLVEETERVRRSQDRLLGEMESLMSNISKVEKETEANLNQQLQLLNDAYFRLRTSLQRPSTSLDLFWGLSAHLIGLVVGVWTFIFKFYFLLSFIVLLPFRTPAYLYRATKWLFMWVFIFGL